MTDKLEKNDIVMYEDNYALISKENIKYNSLNSIKDISIGVLNSDLENRRLEENLLVGECNQIKEKLAKEKLVFKVKTGKQDMMFGQISIKQIKEELSKLGYKIEKTQILLDHPITSLGTHNVEIELHKKVKAVIKVQVVKE